MNKFEGLKSEKKLVDTQAKNLIIIADESNRVANVAKNASIIIEDIDRRFAQVTKLDKIDISFLFLATALQCVRQYLLTPFKERVDDKTGAKNAKGKTTEHTNRHHQWYKPSLEEIMTNPVPFDAIFGSPDFNLGIGGGFNHRASTLGHDPILGWIFGTMNTVTSTLTTWKFESYHVRTAYIANGNKRDKISNEADTSKVFFYTKENLLNGGAEGRTKIGVALIKQAQHLKSDVNTYASLPFPIVSTISPKLAKKLADYGIDTANLLGIGSQAGLSMLINTLIAMMHGLFYDGAKYSSWSIYETKTRKILSYSNIIASTSNILAVSITEMIAGSTGDIELSKKGLRYLDVGGFMVTLYRLISDYKFISRIKKEFLENEFYNIVLGKEYDF